MSIGWKTCLVTMVAATIAARVSSSANTAEDEADGREGYTRQVAVVLYEGVELLDFAGPGEVFAVAAGLAADRGVAAFEVFTVAETSEPIVSQGFLTVTPDRDFAHARAPDIVVIPGGSSSRLTGSDAFRSWLDEVAGRATILTVCTGAFPVAESGLLDGLEVTTWYGALDRLQRAAPAARVQSGRRFVDNGTIITTAGVSAGIDGALHLVARLLGRAVADRTAEYMEYAWSPEPYLARTYRILNPSLDDIGRTAQEADLAFRCGDWAQAAAAYARVVAADPGDGGSWERLGRCRLSLSQLGPAAEAFMRAAEDASRRPGSLYGAARALALDGRSREALDALEEAAAAGFDAFDHMQHDPDLESLRSSARFWALTQGP